MSSETKPMSFNYDFEKTYEQNHEVYMEKVHRRYPQLKEPDLEKIVKKLIPPWVKCPANDNKPVEPINCHFCPCGHMTDCHFPLSCEEANCSHYLNNYNPDEN